MESKLIKRVMVEALVLVVISFLGLAVFSFFSSDESENRIQQNYAEVFYDVLPADHYEELVLDNLDSYEGLNSVYEAFDANGKPLGFITDILVVTPNQTELHLLTGITYDGAELTGISRINDELNPVPITDNEIAIIASQAVGCQIPLYVNRTTMEELSAEAIVNKIPGLHDGVFYAQATVPDSNGYIDYVEIEVQNGFIIRVQWDAFNIEHTTKNRIEASLSGAYPVSGESWATQSYNLCHALIDCQDPNYLAMKSDGTTTIVDGVTIPISTFVDLAYECISNSIYDFDEEAYFDGLISIIEGITGSNAEYLGLYNKDGFIVYSFKNYPDTFIVYDEEDNAIGESNVRMITLEDYDAVDILSFDDATIQYYDPNSDFSVNGAEDGVNVGYVYSSDENIDGIPLSEIRTKIDGLPGSYQRSRYVVTAVNVSYRFLKDYLNWMA